MLPSKYYTTGCSHIRKRKPKKTPLRNFFALRKTHGSTLTGCGVMSDKVDESDSSVMEEKSTETDPRFLLNDVLNSLYDFGDPLNDNISNSNKNVKKKKKKNKNLKKTLSKGKGVDANSKTVNAEKTALAGKAKSKIASRFFHKFKEEFLQQCDSDDEVEDGEAVVMDTYVTQSSRQLPLENQPVEVVQFLNTFGQKKNTSGTNSEYVSKIKESNENQKRSTQEFNFEKARLEVHRFGITAYRKEDQRVLEQERAIMLGAKPPKREHVNYKMYQEIAKQKKKADREKCDVEIKSELPKKRKTSDQEGRKTKKKKSAAASESGLMGRFRNGTLILSGKEIKKIQTSKMRK
ncbi:uncharacterized protein C1orf131 homolog [Protopterus annectens]|uniref:uncharacterized protein C1orf131 homolog n=1 Tax=Protopterus annectens TaxID=7888 RepID=UPI001CF98140|nr:uncharacterized protein C1orf131 homolog [Protopterus annectens]